MENFSSICEADSSADWHREYKNLESFLMGPVGR